MDDLDTMDGHGIIQPRWGWVGGRDSVPRVSPAAIGIASPTGLWNFSVFTGGHRRKPYGQDEIFWI